MPKMQNNATKTSKTVTFSSLGIKGRSHTDTSEINWSKPSDWFVSDSDQYSMEFVITGGFGFFDKTNNVDKVAIEVREVGATEKYTISFKSDEEREELLETIKLVCGKQKQEITGCCFQKIPTKHNPYIKVISTDDVEESEQNEIPF